MSERVPQTFVLSWTNERTCRVRWLSNRNLLCRHESPQNEFTAWKLFCSGCTVTKWRWWRWLGRCWRHKKPSATTATRRQPTTKHVILSNSNWTPHLIPILFFLKSWFCLSSFIYLCHFFLMKVTKKLYDTGL